MMNKLRPIGLTLLLVAFGCDSEESPEADTGADSSEVGGYDVAEDTGNGDTASDVSVDAPDVPVIPECPAGTVWDGFECLPPCETVTCDENATCDADAEPLCVCDAGYTGDGMTCWPEGDCAPACGVNEFCDGTGDDAACACVPGAVFEDGACVVVDECAPERVVVVHGAGDAPDCVTESVCFQRTAGELHWFNSVSESAVGAGCGETWTGPAGTEWAFGRCADVEEFTTFADIASCTTAHAQERLRGQRYCLRTVAEDRYFDVEMLDWGVTDDGDASFSYARTEYSGSCHGEAVCVDAVDTFSCRCPGELTYDDTLGCIEPDVCDGDPCGAGNTCQPADGGSFWCVCDAPTAFEKTDYGSEQDCITPDVCVARGESRPIYNAAREGADQVYKCDTISPIGTRWATGACADATAFSRFTGPEFANCGPPSIVDVPGCVHLTAEDLYVDITFSSWTTESNGGGFAYARDTVTLGVACP